ncbi:MAG TPA: M6 family metalloprotease domain-containing protein [Longimicrobiales bacterium]
MAQPCDARAQDRSPPRVVGSAEALSPPVRIAGLDARPAPPLEFSRAWLGRVAEVRRRRAEMHAAGRLDGADPRALADSGAALKGVLRVPVIPVHYADVAVPFSEQRLADRLFGASRGDTLSYADYWREVSGGLLEIQGVVAPWVRLPRSAGHYLARREHGWARFGRVAEFRVEALRAADAVIDFGDFDNDGPDGVPNSGDDDGYVDFVAFVYATDCRGDGRAGAIWPHRGAMRPYATADPAASGGRILISDYVVLPAQEGGTCEPMHIGLLAHETGHALGLPDLYDYDGSSQGIGAWGLMGTGSHSMPFSPAHPSAWEKEMLGWVRVQWIRGDTAGLAIPAVGSARTVFRYDLPGRGGEYLLLENRRLEGSDAYLPGSGLLVWRVDPEPAELGLWNNDERRPAVALIEADGKGELARGRVADAGDPFPGESQRTTLALDPPAAFRLSNIEEQPDGSVRVDVEIGSEGPALVAAPDELRFTVLPGDTALGQVVRVKPEAGAPGTWSAEASAEWLEVERVGDALVVRADPRGLPTGVHTDTVRLVAPPAPDPVKASAPADPAAPTDSAAQEGGDPAVPQPAGRKPAGRSEQSGRATDSATANLPAPRTGPAAAPRLAGRPADPAGGGADAPRAVLGRVVVHVDVAEPGAREVIATAVPWGWGLAAQGGSLFQASYGWDPLALRPRPRLLTLRGGEPYPETLARPPAEALFAPVAADGAVYVLAHARGENYLYRVEPDGRARLIAGRIGTAPAYGAAALRDGSILVADWSGRIQQVAPDGTVRPWTELGRNIYQIAADSAGTVFAASYEGEVIRVGRDGRARVFRTPFGRGRLVAIAATPEGVAYAAERGGEGRIVRIRENGDPELVARVKGAQFYGLAVDSGFLYALDLRHRQLLRIPLRR